MIDNTTILPKVILLKQAFDSGAIPQLHHHEVNPGLAKSDRLNYLYFTLPVSINFQRNSPAMWQAALATYTDPETNYLFHPEIVTSQPFEKVQADLVKHKLALQRNKHTQIWLAIANTLHTHYDDNPLKVLEAGEFDVSKILENIRITNKKLFPYLSGAKMANYWLYILHNYSDAPLRNLHQLSIIPDTHVLQSTMKLGLADKIVEPEVAAKIWFELLEGSTLIPIDMHPVLWNWSRADFKPEV